MTASCMTTPTKRARLRSLSRNSASDRSWSSKRAMSPVCTGRRTPSVAQRSVQGCREALARSIMRGGARREWRCPMVTFAGVDHVSFTVTDLDRSQSFYTSVLDFVPVLDVGYGRILMHPATGFTLSLMKHDGARGGGFTELTTGLDHLGLAAGSRAELEEWERRFDDLGVGYTPIRDMELSFHLNFRDPDDIALELSAPNEHLLAARAALAAGHTSQDDIDAFIDEHDLDLPRVDTT
ncbi:VOC family protein [Nocardioides oleivorans]|uniref:VOC family protein n=2 Tax=Nocardioides oleivorans TaxID=273676 RepID=A0A4Q2RR06_9ACTN|nr:VOC family protein [Nocardioides oleivorans]